MSPKKFGKHPSFNDTIIKGGKIIKIRKDGRIKSIVDDYHPNHKGDIKLENFKTGQK
jgi:hypothetical protein